MLRKYAFLVALLGTGASASTGAEICSALGSGTYLDGKPLKDIVSTLTQTAPTKGEFESTAEYQQRVAKASSGIKQAYIVDWDVSDYFKYDADTQSVTYSPYTLSTTCLTDDYGTPAEIKALRFGSQGGYVNSGYCLSQTVDRKTGTEYEATNGFGAKVTVTPMETKSVGILLGYGESFQDFWTRKKQKFSASPASPFQAKVEPGSAKSLKENGTFLMVVQPKAPYYHQGKYYLEAKFNRPQSISNTTDYLIGDVLCVALADRNLRQVYQTRTITLN